MRFYRIFCECGFCVMQITSNCRRSRFPYSKQLSLLEQLSRAPSDRTELEQTEMVDCTRAPILPKSHASRYRHKVPAVSRPPLIPSMPSSAPRRRATKAARRRSATPRAGGCLRPHPEYAEECKGPCHSRNSALPLYPPRRIRAAALSLDWFLRGHLCTPPGFSRSE